MQNPSELITLLRRMPYFAPLDEATLRLIASRAITRAYAAGEMIALEGEPCAGLFIVQAGRAKIIRLSLQGREHILHIAGPGESFNDVPVFDGGPNPATVQAMEDSVLLIIERAVLTDMLNRYPQLAQAVISVLARRCRDLVAMVEDLSLRSVTARLAGLLLKQAAQPDALTLTRAQMAARLGTVREMVSRSLRELEQGGLVRLDGSRIVLLDRDGLTQRAGH
jgi:CRP/FNR family transcriptional regulator